MNKPILAATMANGYRGRSAAGQVLAKCLARDYAQPDPIILALPRGGVSVAREIAESLHAPLEVFVVRKIGLPDRSGISIGAIATGGVQLMDDALITAERIPPGTVLSQIAAETVELNRRERLYRGDRPPRSVENRAVVLIDDGMVTGYTMRVAVLALLQLNPAHVAIAIPVGAPIPCTLLEGLVDQLICPLRPEPFHAVGLSYDHFPALTDENVRSDMAAAEEAYQRWQQNESAE